MAVFGPPGGVGDDGRAAPVAVAPVDDDPPDAAAAAPAAGEFTGELGREEEDYEMHGWCVSN